MGVSDGRGTPVRVLLATSGNLNTASRERNPDTSVPPWRKRTWREGEPPWRQPRGKWMVSLVNSHTHATRIGLHLWEIDLRFALNSTPGWRASASHQQIPGNLTTASRERNPRETPVPPWRTSTWREGRGRGGGIGRGRGRGRRRGRGTQRERERETASERRTDRASARESERARGRQRERKRERKRDRERAGCT